MRGRILKLIYDFLDRELPYSLDRDIEVDYLINVDHIIDILGARRAGKTYLMYNIMRRLLKRGVDRKRLIYINLEYGEALEYTFEDLDDIIDYIHRERITDKCYLFLDEIHLVENWENWVRKIYDLYKGKIKIFISGSTSKIQKPEVATKLTGRHITLELFPLSFREFLMFKGLNINKLERKDVLTPTEESMLRGLLEEYMEFGGYPEVVLETNPKTKIAILSNYYNDLLYRDIIIRYKIRESKPMEVFFRRIVSNISKYFSYNRMKNIMRSMGIKVSLDTIYRWTGILEEIYLVFFVPILTKKLTVESKTPKKNYIIDVGLRRVILRRDIEESRILENIVFLELRRRKTPPIEIRYWKENNNEVDFVITDAGDPIIAIQVTETLRDPDTKKREIKPLIRIAGKHKIEKLLVITKHEEQIINTKTQKIEVIPYWKFALNPSQYITY